MLPAVRRLVILFHAGLLWTVSKADASSCSPDQASKCKNAAVENKLGELPAAGQCEPGKYADYYTHQCTVNNYIPTADYCCCAYEQQVLCCRFHYSGNYFRCNVDDDTVHTLSLIPLPIEILVPAIVVPSVALLCFLFYCIRCCCCNDEDDDDGHTCAIFSRHRRRRRRKKSPTIRQEDITAPDNQTSTLLPSFKDSSITNSSKTSSEKCDQLKDIKYQELESVNRTQPSAPPYEANGSCNPPPYNPGLYGRTLAGTTLPCIRSQNEFGQDVIYQPVIAHAHIPLPVTQLSQLPLTTTVLTEQNYDSSNSCTQHDDSEKR